MNHLLNVKNTVFAAGAALGSWVAALFGGWDGSLKALLFLIAIDYITGLVVAGVFHASTKSNGGALESRAGFKGLVRKCGILALVLVAQLVDVTTGQSFVRTAVCLFFVANEALSVLENVGLMGVPYPNFLKKMLEVLRDKGDNPEELS